MANAPKPKKKDVTFRCAYNRLRPKERLSYVVGPSVAVDVLGFRQCVSYSITAPPVAPGPESVRDEIGLRQVVSFSIADQPGVTMPENRFWQITHDRLFSTKTSAQGGDQAAVSSILLLMATYDHDPPDSIPAAVKRLKVILGDSAALRLFEKLTYQLR